MKKILVGVDGSPRQAGVIARAVELARSSGARITLLRAASVPTELPPEAYLMPDEELAKTLEKHALGELNEAAHAIPIGIVEDLLVVLDEPWRAICKTADERQIDRIVIGAHGYGLIERIVGTTASKVVNHSTRSVLVVR